MSTLSASPERREPATRLGALVRRAIRTLDADCIGSASFDALTLRYQPVIDRLPAKEPDDRYPSAALFLGDLSAVRAPIRTSVSGVGQLGVLNS